MKQKLTSVKGEVCNSTVVTGDFDTTPSVMDRTNRQKIKSTRK